MPVVYAQYVVRTKWQPLELENEANAKCQKLQFLKWSLEAGSKKRVNLHRPPYIKMPNYAADINMFTACVGGATEAESSGSIPACCPFLSVIPPLSPPIPDYL